MEETKPKISTANKEDILGGSPHIEGDALPAVVDQSEQAISADLKKYGLKAEEQITVTNPFTGKSTEVTLRRDGTPDSELAIALTDMKMPREQKDAVLANYLWQRGKENASFVMELFQYKGQHAKETQAFKKQMRFDYEMFVDTFCQFLHSQASAITKSLEIPSIQDMVDEYIEYAEKHKGEPMTYNDALLANGKDAVSPERLALIEMAMRLHEEADKLTSVVQNVAQNRMAEKGYGIYIDIHGRPYNIFDTDIVKKVEDDVIAANKLKEDYDREHAKGNE